MGQRTLAMALFLWLFFGNGGRVAGHCGWVFTDGFQMGGFAV